MDLWAKITFRGESDYLSHIAKLMLVCRFLHVYNMYAYIYIYSFEMHRNEYNHLFIVTVTTIKQSIFEYVE
jgi:hypothetical protein